MKPKNNLIAELFAITVNGKAERFLDFTIVTFQSQVRRVFVVAIWVDDLPRPRVFVSTDGEAGQIHLVRVFRQIAINFRFFRLLHRGN